MKKVEKSYVGGNTKWMGKAGVRAFSFLYSTTWHCWQTLMEISNGVLRDPRVFHLDGPGWIDKFNEQGLILFYKIVNLLAR